MQIVFMSNLHKSKNKFRHVRGRRDDDDDDAAAGYRGAVIDVAVSVSTSPLALQPMMVVPMTATKASMTSVFIRVSFALRASKWLDLLQTPANYGLARNHVNFQSSPQHEMKLS